MSSFKPMLAPNEELDFSTLRFPVIASYKLDGIRCVFINGKILSRSLKPIRNKNIQQRFKHISDYCTKNNLILDGELYYHTKTFQEITSIVMSEDKECDKILFNCFDCLYNNDTSLPFHKRLDILNKINLPYMVVIQQFKLDNVNQLNQYFKMALKDGYEGLIVRAVDSPYKYGRATMKQAYMFKLKPYKTFDAKIIGIEERLDSTNESFINELGQRKKRDLKDAKRRSGLASSFIVKLEDGSEQKVSITGNEDFRRWCWEARDNLIKRNQWIEFRGMEVGSKDKKRHPTFIRFRDDKNG